MKEIALTAEADERKIAIKGDLIDEKLGNRSNPYLILDETL